MATVNHITLEDAREPANATAKPIFTASQDTRLTVWGTADSAGNGSKMNEKKNCAGCDSWMPYAGCISQFGCDKEQGLNLEDYLARQQDWFLDTFGPGTRDDGLIKHIKKELDEIREAPGDVEEWVDVIILGIEGALRNAESPGRAGKIHEVIGYLICKQNKNIARAWPDWRKSDVDQPIEHIKPEK